MPAVASRSARCVSGECEAEDILGAPRVGVSYALPDFGRRGRTRWERTGRSSSATAGAVFAVDVAAQLGRQ
ncbi:hypothetical protein AQJ23_01730 [Streptomyces antibioticus]|nr:hypothetical protein AQJ23_01730 [Streptomyces antibioticus]